MECRLLNSQDLHFSHHVDQSAGEGGDCHFAVTGRADGTLGAAQPLPRSVNLQ